MIQMLKDIRTVASALGVRSGELLLSGPYKAKVDLSILGRLPKKRPAKYILVSAITPTPLGEGKTVTTIALSMALNRLRHKAICTLRQSSMGPLFGAKGAANGGGSAQVLPADEINLHFTGDMHAVTAANNLLVAFLENTIFHGNGLGIDPDSISIRRCLDSSDRALRHVRYTLKTPAAGCDILTGFETTAATEAMSILALSKDFTDLKKRLGAMAVARRTDGTVVCARDLHVDGLMAAVLRDAIRPNLVQTSEGTPCFIHAGPFANVSICTSSVVADRMALGLCDYVVTESGFGADCGAEKFFDIKCRYGGFRPDACVLVCSARGLKAQSTRCQITPGQKIDPCIFEEDMTALEEGSVNLKKQIENIRAFGLPVIVSVSTFPTDTAQEIDWLCRKALEFGAHEAHASTGWKEGSRGVLDLAKSVVKLTQTPPDFRFLYDDDLAAEEKITRIAQRIYGARQVAFSPHALAMLDFCQRSGFGRLPVCVAKTQFSLSHDETWRGAPKDYVFPVKDVRLCSGAGFLLAFASTMQTMPGLPVEPRGEKIDVDAQGRISGLM